MRVLLFLLCFFGFQSYGQTFSNNTVNTTGSWDVSLSKSIVVSGIGVLSNATRVLKQVNINLGGQTESTRNFGLYTIKLTSPTGATINIVSPGAFPNSFNLQFNSKFRDNSTLQVPSITSGSQGAQPWDIGYYGVSVANSFSTFNTLNADGTWTLTISETSSSSGARFNNVDLVFGPPIVVTDISSSTINDLCITPQCVDGASVIKATIAGYTGSSANDPNVTSTYPSGCQWNAAKNNSGWFFFRPSSTNVKITISGIDAVIQSLVINPTNNCTAGSQSVPAGGCPIDAVNDTYPSNRYTSTSGSSSNQQFNLSGLTANSNYYLVIDGNGGAISPLYIELVGSATSCNILLPIELTHFDYSCHNDQIKLNWSTASETNNSHFTILGSTDANEWLEIGTKIGAGYSSETRQYEFDVQSQFSYLKYFKLVQHDYDTRSKFSNIISVYCDAENLIDFYPNPFNNELNFTVKSNESVSYEITTVLGQIVNSGVISNDNSRVSLEDLASDIYFIKINNSKVHKIIKQ